MRAMAVSLSVATSFGPVARSWTTQLTTSDSAWRRVAVLGFSSASQATRWSAAVFPWDRHVQDEGWPREAGSCPSPAGLTGQRVVEFPKAMDVDQCGELVT